MSKSVTRANSARWATSLKPAQLCVQMLPMHLVTITVFFAIPSVVAFNSVSHCSRVTKRSFFHHVPHHRRHIRIPVLASPLLYRAVVVASSPSSSPSQRVTIESHQNAIHRQKSKAPKVQAVGRQCNIFQTKVFSLVLLLLLDFTLFYYKFTYLILFSKTRLTRPLPSPSPPFRL